MDGIETNNNGGKEMNKAQRNEKIEMVAANYRKLQNMTTCREVTYRINICIEQLVELTGFNKWEVMAIYEDK